MIVSGWLFLVSWQKTVSVHRVSEDLEGFSWLPWLTLENSSQLKAFKTKWFVGLSCSFRSGSCVLRMMSFYTEQRKCKPLSSWGAKKWKLEQIHHPIAVLSGYNADWRSSESSGWDWKPMGLAAGTTEWANQLGLQRSSINPHQWIAPQSGARKRIQERERGCRMQHEDKSLRDTKHLCF